ncbi:MAG: DNA methyltransferase [Desulfobacterales bacterium]
MTGTGSTFFGEFDFQVLDSGEFKEDAVREELVNPIVKKLGYKAYGHNRIVYSKTLAHPFVKIGSQKREIKIVPDYLFEINGKYAWVLDAKAPGENILTGDHIEQVYSYAIHPDIRADIFALCNGREFAAYSKEKKEPLLFFQLSEIDKHWEEIEKILAPDRFAEKQILQEKEQKYETKEKFSYRDLKLPKTIKPKKQGTRRHFGVHGYFTKQSWDILQHYIKHFTQPGDTVLDPFGGTGVTAIEAMMLGRKAISIDINPMAVFWVKTLTVPLDFNLFTEEYHQLTEKFKKNCPSTKEEIKKAKKKYPYPTNPICMKGADVDRVDQLFTDKQLAQLAYLKHLIKKVDNESVRDTLMFMFSGLLTKTNLTYHTTPNRGSTGGGDTSAFRYYRYRIAPKPVDADVLTYFELRFKKIMAAKQEMKHFITKENYHNLRMEKGSATDLSRIEDESIDYIYTDPPYGDKIPYLDLSVMWNAWLDLEVTDEDRKTEVIEGGRLEKTREQYSDLLAKSIREMYRVLKFDRWMSFVFAHKDPHYWHMIVDTAEKCGFEYAGAVKQENGQTSFKKRQNPFSVLSGQLIIHFIKKQTPKTIQKVNLGSDVYDLIIETIESVIAKNNGATLEDINSELIIKGLEFGFLDILSREYRDLTPLLVNHFDYDKEQMLSYSQFAGSSNKNSAGFADKIFSAVLT